MNVKELREQFQKSKIIAPKIPQPAIISKFPKSHINSPQVNTLNIFVPTVPQNNIESTTVKKKQSQINFEDILQEVDSRAMSRSGIKIRYGINERHPTTKQQQLIFDEIMRQSQQQFSKDKDQTPSKTTQKQNCQKNTSVKLQSTKSKVFQNNISYIDKSSQQKQTRINFVISSIFKDKNQEIVNTNRKEQHQQEQIRKNIYAKSQLLEVYPNTVNRFSINNEQPKQPTIKPTYNQPKEQYSTKIVQQPPQPRKSMMAMDNKMLGEISQKFKKRNQQIVQSNTLVVKESPKRQQRSVSKRKKKVFEAFDDA